MGERNKNMNHEPNLHIQYHNNKQRKNSQTNEWNVQYLKILHEYSFWLNYYFYPCGHGFGSACLSVTVRNKIS